MTATPIPAGVLTVDDEPDIPDAAGLYAVRVEGVVWHRVTRHVRAGLVAGPARPDGVPEHAVPVTMWVGPDQGDASARMWLGDGTPTDFLADVIWFRDIGVPVPPYQPAPDPEALLVEKIAADWTAPDPADSPTDHVEHYRTCNCLADSAECCRSSCACHAIPVAGERPDESQVAEPPSERTGPLGLNEQEVRFWAGRDAVYAGPWAEGARALQAACRAAVAEWDAQPEPAETHAAIAAECRGWTYDKWYDDPRSFEYYMHQLADRIEAASRPDPDTITVNSDDLRAVIARHTDSTVVWSDDQLRSSLAAAAGLPQEPTEPEPTEPEAQR